MNEISINADLINIFHLFAATRCCPDKRQGKKNTGGLGCGGVSVGSLKVTTHEISVESNSRTKHLKQYRRDEA